jgi:threonyl-tRNA synthetase
VDLRLPDGKVVSHDRGVTGAEVARAIGPGLARAAVAVKVDGAELDLATPITDGEQFEVITLDSDTGLHILRHSTAHVMAQAVLDLYPGSTFAIGPPIEDGFYYDFEVAEPFTPEDLERIEARMAEIIAEDQPFERVAMRRDEALEVFSDHKFKVEIIENVDSSEVTEGEEVTAYRNLDFIDLCRGPHLPSTGRIPAFKVLRNSGAYWRGDQGREQLQRIYGTAWASKADLDGYLTRIEEAEKRDHRRLGRELELFHLDPTAPGMPYWLPRGLKLFNALLDFWREDHERRGYQEISAPMINEKSLWVTSGHWDNFAEDMFKIPIDEYTTYGVKPMNCPNAMVVYNLKTRSYRDLPLRLSDVDVLHRHEMSGTLHGLLRVRRFQQDDAHIFCSVDQIKEEYERIFEICDYFYSIFDLSYELQLGTRPEKFIGDVETWNHAEQTLKDILGERAGPFRIVEGDGAFYGPKVDIMMKDTLGRKWQMGTIQLDFQLPRRFDCTYVDSDGERKTPVVIHRVIYGSLERFIGILIEHTAGAFPLWLAPTQVKVIPIRSEQSNYADEVAEHLRASRLRFEVDRTDEPLNAKIRRAQVEKVPVMIILGERESSERTVTARLRTGANLPSMELDELLDLLQASIERKDYGLGRMEESAVE